MAREPKKIGTCTEDLDDRSSCCRAPIVWFEPEGYAGCEECEAIMIGGRDGRTRAGAKLLAKRLGRRLE